MSNTYFNQLPKARTEKLIVKELPDETLVYDPQTDQAYCLNRTAKLVWENCDGNRPVDEIAGRVEKDLGTTVSADAIWLALDQLEKSKLLEKSVSAPAHVAGMSRRRAIQTLGLAAAAIPVITSIIVPIAAQAQSCGAPSSRPNGCACTASSQCTSGCCRPNLTCDAPNASCLA